MGDLASCQQTRPRADPIPHVLILRAARPAGDPAEGLPPALTRALVRCQLTVESESDLEALLAGADRLPPALAIIEQSAADPGRFGALEALLRRWPRVPVLVLSDSPSVREAVHAMSSGAIWYGGRSAEAELGRVIAETLARRTAEILREAPPAGPGGARVIGSGEAMRRTLRQAALVAPTRTTVLLLGETGTGKERLAQAIHEGSPRRSRSFVGVNCAALAETLLESELFGHERGAFSGAHARRAGRFEAADGGTIFLDEIGEISPAVQVKLLRVLQERSFERVGGNQTLSVDVRIIAATNRDLRQMVAEKTFRADLFYRLNVMSIRVPPLRERREDIPELVAHLMPRLALEHGLPEPPVSPAAMRELLAHDWPGNVRELENSLQRALVLAQGGAVSGFDLLPSVSSRSSGPPGPPLVPGASFREIERHAIMTTYEACGRSPVRTAEVLGLSARTVHYRLREYQGQQGRRRPRGEPFARQVPALRAVTGPTPQTDSEDVWKDRTPWPNRSS
jgi:DNA-binding NtrC family response regulator